MSESLKTTVICQDPGDGSEDVIIDLPPIVLAALDVSLGGSLSIELVDGTIVLKKIYDSDSKT